MVHIFTSTSFYKNMFDKYDKFDIKHLSNLINLINKIHSFDFDSYDVDILGSAYQDVIKDLITGSVLGQFFTPHKIKKSYFKSCQTQII